jgi:hypothetical protein
MTGERIMSEVIVDFSDIQQALEPVFGGKSVKIVVQKSKAIISTEQKPKRQLKAFGICHDRANPELRKLEKYAFGMAMEEKYGKKINT